VGVCACACVRVHVRVRVRVRARARARVCMRVCMCLREGVKVYIEFYVSRKAVTQSFGLGPGSDCVGVRRCV